jgi:YVTN family beta-propeller protein
VDAVRHQPVGLIELGNPELKPMGVVLSPDATKAYVSTGRGRKVFVIETAGNTIAGSFEVGVRPWGLAVSPGGATLYTANGPSNDVSVVDLATQRVIKTIKVGDRPWGVITLPKSW